MRKLLAVGAVICLMLLTAAVVALPLYAYELQLRDTVSSTRPWHYDGYQATLMTPRELVDAFQTGGVGFGQNPPAESVTAEEAYRIVARLAADTPHLKESLVPLLSDSTAADMFDCGRQIGMTIKDGQPIVVSILMVAWRVDDEQSVELGLEEKTGTVLWMMYTNNNGEYDTAKVLASQAARYYEECIGVSPERYMVEMYTIENAVQMYAAALR